MISRAITRLVRAIDLAFLRWALRSIHPLHPDVPFIVSQIAERSQPMNTTRPTALHPHRQHTDLADLTLQATTRRTDWGRLAVALATALAVAVLVWELLP